MCLTVADRDQEARNMARNFDGGMDEQRRRWESLKLAVGKADIQMQKSFHSSCHYWQSGEVPHTKQWSIRATGELLFSPAFTDKASVLIEGDCRTNLSLTSGGLIHIYGDLANTITIRGQSEIVIGGHILPGAAIELDEARGIAHVFVGSDMSGTISSRGSVTVWIGGNFGGDLQTGSPSTRIHIEGDASGRVEPIHEAGLVYLDVNGFMSYRDLELIGNHNYTELNASLGISDRPPGFYPEGADWARRANRRNLYRWIIHSS
jgi:hypothetical protein